MRRSDLRAAVVLICVLSAPTFLPAADVVIENHDKQSFYYSVRANDTKKWSKSYEIKPGERQSHPTSNRLRISYLTASAQFAWLESQKVYRIDNVEQGELRAVTQVLRPAVPDSTSEANPGSAPEPTDEASNDPTSRNAPESTSRSTDDPEPAPAASSRAADPSPATTDPSSATPSTAIPEPASSDETFEGLFDITNRVVTVRAIADTTYRNSFPEWRERLRSVVEGASEYYQREFRIRLVITETQEWDYNAVNDDLETRWSRLLEQSPQDFDLVIALVGYGDYSNVQGDTTFTGQLGRAAFFGQHLMVADRKDYHANRAKTILIHELGHVFGAFHVDDQNLLMYPGYLQLPTENIIAGTVPFGEAFNQIFSVTKEFNFQAGVAGLSSETQRKIQALYRKHGLKAESRQTDPITSGYKYLEQRAKIVADQMAKQAEASRGAFDGLAE